MLRNVPGTSFGSAFLMARLANKEKTAKVSTTNKRATWVLVIHSSCPNSSYRSRPSTPKVTLVSAAASMPILKTLPGPTFSPSFVYKFL